MAKVFQQVSSQLSGTGSNFADNTTRFVALGGYLRPEATEAEMQVPFYTAVGIFNTARAFVAANDVNATATITLRQDAADTSVVISITANTTGTFSDTTNSYTTTAGDLMCWEVTVPAVAGNHSITLRNIYVEFNCATTTFKRWIGSSAGLTFSSVTTLYLNTGNNIAFSGAQVESQVKYQINSSSGQNNPGTLRNGMAYVNANDRSVNTTLRSRVDGANGNIVVSITANTTGLFEDTSGEDDLSGAAQRDVNFSIVTTAGTGSITITCFGLEHESGFSLSEMVSCFADEITFIASSTSYMTLEGGNWETGQGAETGFTQLSTSFATQCPIFQIVVGTNLATGDGTFSLRLGGADHGTPISVTALTSGKFTDTTTDGLDIVIGSLLNFKFDCGSGANTNLALVGAQIKDATPAAAAAPAAPSVGMRRRNLVGVGL